MLQDCIWLTEYEIYGSGLKTRSIEYVETLIERIDEELAPYQWHISYGFKNPQIEADVRYLKYLRKSVKLSLAWKKRKATKA